MIRQRNRAIQRLCKLLSTNMEAHVQAHIDCGIARREPDQVPQDKCSLQALAQRAEGCLCISVQTAAIARNFTPEEEVETLALY